LITIIDYGMGNPESIKNMIKKAGGRAEITTNKDKIAEATALILPGVGHFGTAMNLIRNQGFKEIMDKKIKEENTPLLGVCLGMQLLFDHSEEGDSTGLGYISGEVKKFNFTDTSLKIPHMGWSEIDIKKSSVLFDPYAAENPRFYFVHSYYVSCKEASDVLATCNYGNDFDCAVQKGNVTGVQFHPEKSHRFGLEFFKKYLEKNAEFA